MLAPTVSNFVVTVPKAAFGTGPTGNFGVYNKTVTYSATVAPGAIQGGASGLVQLANLNWYWQDFAGNTMGIKFPVGPDGDTLYALDQPNNAPTPYYSQYFVPTPGYAVTTIGGTIGAKSAAVDRPGLDLAIPAQGWLTDVASYTMKFQTFANFQAGGGGLHIELAEVDWTITAWVNWTDSVYSGTVHQCCQLELGGQQRDRGEHQFSIFQYGI